MSPMPPLPTNIQVVLIDEDGEHSDRSYDENYSKKEKHLRIINLDEDELSFIFNENKDDIINLFPFNFTFTKEHIWKSWCNIGFIPMNRKCLDNLKVQQELGVDRADDDTNQEVVNCQE